MACRVWTDRAEEGAGNEAMPGSECDTPEASFFDTFLQTLPELVTDVTDQRPGTLSGRVESVPAAGRGIN